jgi:hypothetical protein
LHLLQASILLIEAVAPGCVLIFPVEWSFVLTRCCSRVVSGLSAADRRGFERLHRRVEDFYSRLHHHVLLQGVKIFLLLDGLSGLLVDEFWQAVRLV